MRALFGILSLVFAHAHNCTSNDLHTLPRDVAREKCSTSTTLSANVTTAANDLCLYALSMSGCVFRLSNLGAGVANVTGQTLGCTPLSHAFTWASSISPASGVAFVMGGQGQTSRNLYTVNLLSGAVVYSPTVGGVFNAPYFTAADQRNNNRLYGAWYLENDSYRLVEIDPKTGQVKQYFMSDPAWVPAPGLQCVPYCGFSTNCGYFSIPDNSYVTSWNCRSINVLVRVNVDTLKVTLVKWTSGYDYFIVNSLTGIAYVSTNAYSVSRINEPSGTLTTVITIPNQDVVLFDLTVSETGVCFARAKDINFGRAHPQAEDFICFNEGKADGQEFTQLYSVPYLDQYDMPYVTQSVMGPC